MKQPSVMLTTIISMVGLTELPQGRANSEPCLTHAEQFFLKLPDVTDAITVTAVWKMI